MDLLVDAMGNIPGEFMNGGFLMMKPFQLVAQKYLGLTDVCHREQDVLTFLRTFPGGHIGVYVSGRAQKDLAPGPRGLGEAARLDTVAGRNPYPQGILSSRDQRRL